MRRLISFAAVVATVTFCQSFEPRNYVKFQHQLQTFARQANATLLIDANNLRGQLPDISPQQIHDRLVSSTNLPKNLNFVVVWDHGNVPSAAAALHPHAVVLFSGLNKRADDVLVQQARRFTSSPVAVCTSDSGLRQRLFRLEHVQLWDSTRMAYALTRQEDIPRRSFREQTWQRCIMAEELRRDLLRESPLNDDISSFASEFLCHLDGYDQSIQQPDGGPIFGPRRLDRRQRRKLHSYNKEHYPTKRQ